MPKESTSAHWGARAGMEDPVEWAENCEQVAIHYLRLLELAVVQHLLICTGLALKQSSDPAAEAVRERQASLALNWAKWFSTRLSLSNRAQSNRDVYQPEITELPEKLRYGSCEPKFCRSVAAPTDSYASEQHILNKLSSYLLLSLFGQVPICPSRCMQECLFPYYLLLVNQSCSNRSIEHGMKSFQIPKVTMGFYDEVIQSLYSAQFT